ncbi:phosphate ABC superfamily ATP binding cassette transporter binding protein [Prevotella sp. CAG:1185]|mgnify:CR=1 FL=1|uniref:PstS family phosphate ABC transporter substrate-binding protein n=1 Tax=uncultured Prevotella sp. TaxID=159272 RepID=UPI0003412002|nr:substrate-binding domain-containing protein [uncultured Prevotella sp.]CCY81940.1 phosphate ABC superfamily ATP binding cassette transporter binding protein [Prevotella sp. CAG:1185]
MRKKLFYNLVGLILLSGLLVNCADKPKNGRTDTYSSGAITFASDESFSPIIDEEIQVFESIYRDAKLTPIYTNELDAINMLMNDSLQLVIASRNFTKKELENLKARSYLPVAIPLAYDGLSLIINRENKDSCISVNNIKRVLSGDAKKWSDIVPGSSRGDILVVFDNSKSSTVHFCVDSILGGKPINSPNIVAANTSKEVIDYVEKTPNSIGIIGSNWLNDKRDTTNTTFKKNITVMSVSKFDKATAMNSWKPYQAYLLDGRYPLVRTIYALLNDPINGLPWGFAHFIEQPKGQLIIFKSGLLPVRGDITIRSVNVGDD